MTWAAFRADEEQASAFAEKMRDGPIYARIRSVLLRPTRYSPMQ